MAAAIIPMVAQVAAAVGPEIINLIAGLVHKAAPAAEVSSGPNTGPVKFAEVFASTMQDLAKAHAAGQITGTLPDDATVKVIIQAVVTSMKLGGLLGSSAPAIAGSAAQTLVLKAGQSLLISVN